MRHRVGYLSLLLIPALGLLAAVPGWADPISFTFNQFSASGNAGSFGDLSASAQLLSSGYFLSTDGNFTLKVSSFACESAGCAASDGTASGVNAPDLYFKDTVGDTTETGLGLSGQNGSDSSVGTGDSDNEIGSDYAILITLPLGVLGPELAPPPYAITATLASVQSGENYVIQGANPYGVETLAMGSGGGVDTVALPVVGGGDLLAVTAGGSGDILLQSLQFTPAPPVPEPATWALLGSGMLMLGLLAWRRRLRPRFIPELS